MSTAARALPHPDLVDVDLPQVLFALSDPTRLHLVRELDAQGPLSVAQCQAAGGDVPKSTFSHHLRTLREAGLIWSIPDGRRRTIELRRDEVDHRFPGLLAAVLATGRSGATAPDLPDLTPAPSRSASTVRATS
ncbi:MAG: helix-turn-helix domain-containing protein [Nakamurella multipartita]|jgi:DNA-binding transcriptional ArsR family regulator